ncbi:MAG: 4Fe-4S dicluster domain-containing protein [Candidatus Lokiarchaeota archaeon]|nr:4Fe-4S dicluster domain-containing protein [Candidatus Lokiarchaeota archaeon]
MSDAEGENAYKKLRDIIMMPKNKTSLDVLKIWYTPEDAKVLASGFKTVGMDRFTIKDYAKKTKIPIEKVEETFNRLANRGVLFYYISKRDGKKKFMIPPLFPGLIEYFIINQNVSIDERRKFVEKFHKDEQQALGLITTPSDFSVFRIVPALEPSPDSRLIEVDEKLEPDKSQVLAYQDVEKIIKEAGKEENNIAVVPCTCRTMSMMMKTNPECKAPVDNCLVFGIPARYVVEEGIGRYITVDETMEILKEAEKAGLVHLTQNTVDKQGFICNCCSCCCGILSTAQKYNYWNIFQKTDYIPLFDMDICKHCKKCVDICPFYAISYISGDKEDKSEDKIIVRESVCIGCGLCASNCPGDAITLKKVRDVKPAENFIEAVTKMMTGKSA